MISDEDLRRIAEDDHVHCGDASAMAKELLAYRQAFSEPTAWVYRIDIELGVDQILCRSRESTACKLPLYRKPTIPE
ncbi:hypothetical protein [Pantoea phage PA-1]